MLQIPCPFLGPEALSFTVPLILGTPLTVSWTLYSLVIFCLFFFFLSVQALVACFWLMTQQHTENSDKNVTKRTL